MNRRGFLRGFGVALVAAPAIVRAASLMPVKAIVLPPPAHLPEEIIALLRQRIADAKAVIVHNMTQCLYGEPEVFIVSPGSYRAFIEVLDHA